MRIADRRSRPRSSSRSDSDGLWGMYECDLSGRTAVVAALVGDTGAGQPAAALHFPWASRRRLAAASRSTE